MRIHAQASHNFNKLCNAPCAYYYARGKRAKSMRKAKLEIRVLFVSRLINVRNFLWNKEQGKGWKIGSKILRYTHTATPSLSLLSLATLISPWQLSYYYYNSSSLFWVPVERALKHKIQGRLTRLSSKYIWVRSSSFCDILEEAVHLDYLQAALLLTWRNQLESALNRIHIDYTKFKRDRTFALLTNLCVITDLHVYCLSV